MTTINLGGHDGGIAELTVDAPTATLVLPPKKDEPVVPDLGPGQTEDVNAVQQAKVEAADRADLADMMESDRASTHQRVSSMDGFIEPPFNEGTGTEGGSNSKAAQDRRADFNGSTARVDRQDIAEIQADSEKMGDYFKSDGPIADLNGAPRDRIDEVIGRSSATEGREKWGAKSGDEPTVIPDRVRYVDRVADYYHEVLGDPNRSVSVVEIMMGGADREPVAREAIEVVLRPDRVPLDRFGAMLENSRDNGVDLMKPENLEAILKYVDRVEVYENLDGELMVTFDAGDKGELKMSLLDMKFLFQIKRGNDTQPMWFPDSFGDAPRREALWREFVVTVIDSIVIPGHDVKTPDGKVARIQDTVIGGEARYSGGPRAGKLMGRPSYTVLGRKVWDGAVKAY